MNMKIYMIEIRKNPNQKSQYSLVVAARSIKEAKKLGIEYWKKYFDDELWNDEYVDELIFVWEITETENGYSIYVKGE